MNQLRPEDKIAYEVGKTRTTGRVVSVWHGDRINVRWSDNSLDFLQIDEETARHLTKLSKPAPKAR